METIDENKLITLYIKKTRKLKFERKNEYVFIIPKSLYRLLINKKYVGNLIDNKFYEIKIDPNAEYQIYRYYGKSKTYRKLCIWEGEDLISLIEWEFEELVKN
ncbi:hypothetical protein [Spiroplasma endosymbiont of Glossina fuscipes fuscipes]|uniref:hypothetical protein n=1 Tax=Spiroplasma endosymbiont of Glossina fuscipes fuscipes TaxID=2004463 RepID=UPI003C74A302